jgi:hypothetical protein
VVSFGCGGESTVGEGEAAEQLTFAFCDQVFACTCADSAGFNSVEGCRDTVFRELFDQQDQALAGGLVYDDTCVAEKAERIAELGCERDPAEIVGECDACFTYHGFLPEGSGCQRFGPRASTCAQGLECADRFDYAGNVVNVCVPACERVGKGEACYLEGPEYIVTRACDEGLFCESASTGVCFALPGPGERCASGMCAGGSWCDTSATNPVCAAVKGIGAGCDADLECQSTWCGSGRCATPIEPGLACLPEAHRCVAGYVCPEDRLQCTPIDSLVCRSVGVAL